MLGSIEHKVALMSHHSNSELQLEIEEVTFKKFGYL